MMDADWKVLAVALALIVVLSVITITPVSMAAGGGNTSSSKSPPKNTTQAGNSDQGSKSAKQSPAFVPGGGPAGTGQRIDGVGPHQKGWMGGAMNPWTYGPSAYPYRPNRFGWGLRSTPSQYSRTDVNKN